MPHIPDLLRKPSLTPVKRSLGNVCAGIREHPQPHIPPGMQGPAGTGALHLSAFSAVPWCLRGGIAGMPRAPRSCRALLCLSIPVLVFPCCCQLCIAGSQENFMLFWVKESHPKPVWQCSLKRKPQTHL